jgi:hypothetical protein
MTVYVANFGADVTREVLDRVSKLESGDAIQIFGFPSDELLGAYYRSLLDNFEEKDIKGLRFSKSSIFRIISDRYVMIKKR